MSDLDCRQHWQRYRVVMEIIANRFELQFIVLRNIST